MMKNYPFPGRTLPLMAQAVTCFLIVATTSTLDADDTATDASAPTKSVPRVYRGAKDCLACHTNGLPKVQNDPLLASLGFGGSGLVQDNWVMYDELKTWATNDKHAQAYTSLLSDASKKMGELLGVEEIHRDKRCLACHTGFPLHAMVDEEGKAEAGKMPKSFENDLRVTQGVSCEGCHGASGDVEVDGETYAGWFVPHASKEKWRFLSSAEKSKQYEFYDLRSRATQAMLCASCHIGDASEGRIVTHEMYAAGHPPLPGLELATFIEQMPKHWRDFGEKAEGVQKEYLDRTESSYDAKALHKTKLAAVGIAVAASASFKLTADLAAGEVSEDIAAPSWPELAQYECFACHHELKDKSWRQARTSKVTPGRPLLREWPMALAPLAAELAGEDRGEAERHLAAVDAVLSARPFGQKVALAKAAGETQRWFAMVAQKLETRNFSRTDGIQLLKNISQLANAGIPDYDTARQLVWTFRIVEREVNASEDETELRTLLAEFEKEGFYLDLRAGRKTKHTLPGAETSRDVVEVDLNKVLMPVITYDPGKFQERFAQISKLLKTQ